jgi:hypothetical protein
MGKVMLTYPGLDCHQRGVICLQAPFDAFAVSLAQLHTTGEVQTIEYKEEGVLVRARVPLSVAGRVEEFSTTPVERRPKRLAGRRRREAEAEDQNDAAAEAGEWAALQQQEDQQREVALQAEG